MPPIASQKFDQDGGDRSEPDSDLQGSTVSTYVSSYTEDDGSGYESSVQSGNESSDVEVSFVRTQFAPSVNLRRASISVVQSCPKNSCEEEEEGAKSEPEAESVRQGSVRKDSPPVAGSSAAASDTSREHRSDGEAQSDPKSRRGKKMISSASVPSCPIAGVEPEAKEQRNRPGTAPNTAPTTPAQSPPTTAANSSDEGGEYAISESETYDCFPFGSEGRSLTKDVLTVRRKQQMVRIIQQRIGSLHSR